MTFRKYYSRLKTPEEIKRKANADIHLAERSIGQCAVDHIRQAADEAINDLNKSKEGKS